jgi:ABC-type Fe3+ transport system permease subunit
MSLTTLIIAMVASLVSVTAAVVTLWVERRSKKSLPDELAKLKAAEKDLERALRNLRMLEDSFRRPDEPRPASGT